MVVAAIFEHVVVVIVHVSVRDLVIFAHKSSTVQKQFTTVRYPSKVGLFLCTRRSHSFRVALELLAQKACRRKSLTLAGIPGKCLILTALRWCLFFLVDVLASGQSTTIPNACTIPYQAPYTMIFSQYPVFEFGYQNDHWRPRSRSSLL